MRILTHMAAISSMLIFCAPALADPANVGEPFGKAVVAPNAPVNDAVHENEPGTLDDVIHRNLADEEDNTGDDVPDTYRGHGKKDAPGQN
jgi:hypothetical protein